ncbi:MFS transporter [Paenibacillus protaetiae]|uniref:MFS transporter n=1 Tax=Paenibacillus protaetiae TaxID=2509456 RepID=UPI001FC968A1|nr:MFS transporter [Paenibacillus protaetiae]
MNGQKASAAGGRTFRSSVQIRNASGGLDSQAVLLLVVQALFGIGTALSGTFVPVYLWKASQSYSLIGLFAITGYVTSGLTFWLAGKWVKEHNKMNSLRLGIVLSGAFYFLVLLFGQEAKQYALPLGVLNGVGLGFYWIAYNVVYFEITEPSNRDRYNGYAGLMGAAAGMLAPWISGLLITSFGGERGYTLIFTISLVIFAIGAVFSFWLKKRESAGRYDWKHTYTMLLQSPLWRRLFFAITAQGVREGVFMFLIGLTVYTATQNESKLGSFALITSLVALLSNWIAGRALKPANRGIGMLIGTVMVSAFILPLFWKVNYGIMLLFGIGTALFLPLYMIPMTTRVFDMIGLSEESAKQREEYIVLRELALTVGRSIGVIVYLIVLSVYHTPQTMVWLLFGVGTVPVLAWWLMRPLLPEHPRILQ